MLARGINGYFWSKVDTNGPIPDVGLDPLIDSRVTGNCWQWTGGLFRTGYPACYPNGKTTRAHRLSYEIHNKEIPSGMVIDHLCRNIICVNPNHLEAVTNAENIRRGLAGKFSRNRRLSETCLYGHDLTVTGAVYVYGKSRKCRACTINRVQESRRRSNN
jgi:hypothetical protein